MAGGRELVCAALRFSLERRKLNEEVCRECLSCAIWTVAWPRGEVGWDLGRLPDAELSSVGLLCMSSVRCAEQGDGRSYIRALFLVVLVGSQRTAGDGDD